MAKRGRPATGQAAILNVRIPQGWSRQIDRLGDRSQVARSLIGAGLAARNKVSGSNGVSRINPDTARDFLEVWHYTGTLPTGRNICFGWFIDGQLYAVATYGVGINHGQPAYLARETGKPVRHDNLVVLRRLARSEPARDGDPLTRFLAICHRLLRRDRDIRFIVTFSDPAHGHKGGIYRAANFAHLGKTINEEAHVIDGKGRLRSRRMVRHHAKRKGITQAEARAGLGLKVQRTRKRDRWFLDLGERRERHARA